MRVITFSLLLNLLIAETTFPGLENWYHPHRMSLTGAGGTVTNITADIANPAALWTLPRLFEVSFVSYPADITAQSGLLYTADAADEGLVVALRAPCFIT